MVYTLAVHVPIVGLAMLPVLFGLPLVLAPLHIAFLELVIDPACSLVFEAEDGDPDLMHQPPRRAGAALLTTTLVTPSLPQGGLVTAMVVGVYAGLLGLGMPGGMASIAAFVALVSANASLILPSRTDRTDWRSLGAGLTPVSRWVMACTLLALLTVTAIPSLARNFGFLPLAPLQWLAALAVGLAMAPLLHLSKVLLVRRPGPLATMAQT